MRNQKHLIFSELQGTADLECPEYGLITSNLEVIFYPERLDFELYLDAADSLVDALAYERRPLHLWLRNVKLFYEDGCCTMQAESLCLRRANALSEWPEAFGGLVEVGEVKRRLLLTSDVQCIELQCEKAFPTPYQIYYADSCSSIGAPYSVKHVSLQGPVFLNASWPKQGFFRVYGEQDFFSQEERLRAAFEFIHGRYLRVVCEIQEEIVRFYGARLKESVNYMPSSREKDFRYMEAVIHGFLNLDAKTFASSRAALSFHLAGKQTDIFSEGRYMLQMTCIEAMDGIRQLRTERTSALLGVSESAASLINGMRNELVHGKGGYKQAYADFRAGKTGELDLEDGVAPCIRSDGSLDFVHLWLRLCERLDAFWCAYLKLDASLQERRYAMLPLMAAIAWSEPLQGEDVQPESKQSAQLEELRKKIQRLERELEKKNGQLIKQGDRIKFLQAESKRSQVI